MGNIKCSSDSGMFSYHTSDLTFLETDVFVRLVKGVGRRVNAQSTGDGLYVVTVSGLDTKTDMEMCQKAEREALASDVYDF